MNAASVILLISIAVWLCLALRSAKKADPCAGCRHPCGCKGSCQKIKDEK